MKETKFQALNRAYVAIQQDLNRGMRPTGGDLALFRGLVEDYIHEADALDHHTNRQNKARATAALNRIEAAVQQLDKAQERTPAEFNAELITKAREELEELEDELEDATTAIAKRNLKARIAKVQERIDNLKAN